MKARVEITRDIAALNRPLLWRWYVTLWGGNNRGHIYACSMDVGGDRTGYRTRLGAWLGFLRDGTGWALRAWIL